MMICLAWLPQVLITSGPGRLVVDHRTWIKGTERRGEKTHSRCSYSVVGPDNVVALLL